MSQEDLKSNERGGFNRMRPRPDGNGNDPRRGPKFNIYWIWGALAVILLGFNLFSSFAQDARRITFAEFNEHMLAKGDVEKIVLISNKNLVRVFIKPDSLKKEYYQSKLPKGFNAATDKGPQFEFTIAKPEIFTDDLRDFHAKNPQVREVPRIDDTEGDWLAPIFQFVLPIFIIVLIWVLLMRKMGGGAGGGGLNEVAALGSRAGRRPDVPA